MKKLVLALLLFFGTFQMLKAQDFITTWGREINTNFPVQIKFNTVTSGIVNYTWTTVAPSAPASGSGSFNGGLVVISGLPPGLIRLSIDPVNFKRFNLITVYSSYNSLRFVNQWGNVAWTSMENAFSDDDSLENFQIIATDIPNLIAVTSLKNMFKNCRELNSPFNINSWNVSNVTNLSGMFNNCWAFNQSMSNWNTANVTDMSEMFTGAYNFNLNLANWNTANVTNMSGMFSGASKFNRPIGNWNTSKVTNMSGMFAGHQNLGQGFNQNISNWNTSLVINMSNMFSLNVNFNQNISNWNISNVTNLSGMFSGSTSFNQNLGSWNTSNVTNMSYFFAQASNFNNNNSSSLSNWNTSNVTNMSGVFQEATAFDHPLNWTLNPQVNLTQMLDSSGMSCTNYSATLQGWSNNPSTPSNRILGATFMEYGPQAIAAVNNLVVNKGWGFSGHDLLNVTPTFQPLSSVCSGSIIAALPLISENWVSGSWSPALNNTATTLYTFTPNAGQCSAATTTLNITVTPRPSISGNATQILNQNATVGSIIVTPSNVVWYATLANAQNATSAIANTTPIVAGNYYGVTTSGNCSSLPFLVTVSIALSNDEFDVSNLKYYPNPTNGILNLSYSQAITNIEITNILGQKVLAQKPNSKNVELNLSSLNAGNYFVKIKSDGLEKVIKILKN